MEQQDQTLLVIAARLLAYPDDNFIDEQLIIKDVINENIELAELRQELLNALEAFHRLTPEDLKKLYVSTFDLKAKHGLYLTAHELGDSSKRGAAIIRLQNIISQAGFERVDDELADYIPMLFEFLAAAPESEENSRLKRRLAIAVQRIQASLPSDNPYFNILYLLMEYVFPQPTKEEIKRLEFEREDADLEELPYPIMYG